jgi:hypothetical protein
MALLCALSTARGAIVGTTGDFLVIPSATASYVANTYNDPDPAPIRIWTEQEPVSLASAVTLDTDLADPTLRYVTGAAGAGEVAFAVGGGPTLPVGTLVNVYYVYLDPVSDTAAGTVTFDMPVLGIVAHTSQLQFSDFLRVPGAPYPGNPSSTNRGWETSEWGQLSADRRTLAFSGSAGSPGDQFRIITAAVPEPASLLLLGAGLVLISLRRRR